MDSREQTEIALLRQMRENGGEMKLQVCGSTIPSVRLLERLVEEGRVEYVATEWPAGIATYRLRGARGTAPGAE